jgi:uncharacterized membrane protein YbhN (UPF0104 family)
VSGEKRAVAIFVLGLALGFAGLYLVAGDQIFRIETYRVRDPSVLVVALCGVAFIAEWFVMDCARIWLLCRNQRIPLSFRSAVLVHLTSMFVASVTPGNAAVGPTTAVALSRLGVPLGRGIGVAVQVIILDMIVLAIIGAVFLTRYPRPVVRVILAIARWPLLSGFAPRLRKIARDYYRSARAFKNMAVSTWLALNLIVAAGWFSGFVLFWLLLKLYGVGIGPLATLAIVNSITLVAHIFPTPGGSGFMEAALGLSVGASGENVAAALLIWRLASYHVIFLLGPLAGWLLYVSKPAAKDRTGAA